MSEREEILNAIDVLEAQRNLLGDEVVDAALAPLRQQLTTDERSDRKIGAKLSEERKLITVLFADVVGSTAMAESLGSETTRLMMDRCLQRASKAVEEFGGTISQLLGDGLLAYFGVPQAHEDDPERAAMAAMQIHKYVDGYAQDLGQKIEMRVGINTGRVVLGEMGGDIHSEYLASGSPVNLAARLQSAANPGKTLLGETTARMVRYRFQVEPVRLLSLKGFQEPVKAHELGGELLQSKPARGIPGVRSPLVGRDAELGQLVEMAAGLEGGNGGIATLIGEPGIGKSRLLQETKVAHQNGKLRFAEGRAYSYTQDQPFSVVLDVLAELLDLAADDSPAIMDLKLESTLSPLFNEELESVWPFLSTLLGAPIPPQYATALSGLDPEALNARMIQSVQMLVEKMAERRPLVLSFEDLHWADGGSLKLIETLMLATEHFPIFLILLFRPDFDKPVWQLKLTADLHFKHRYLELTLSPLDSNASRQLINNLLEATNFSDDLQEMIGEKAQGNPLYVEELIRSLIESGFMVRAGNTWLMQGQPTELEVPETLENVIQARLDRLPPAERSTLQTASVIGRRFAYRVLEAMVLAEGNLRNHLLKLQQVGLVRERSRLPEPEYIFKHVIVQQVTYSTLLDEQRRQLHLRAAETLEGLFPDKRDEFAGSLAQHYAAAGESRKAISLFIEAADRAKKVYAYEEALHFLQSAQRLSEIVVLAPKDEVALLEQLADIHVRVREYLEAIRVFQQALDLLHSLEEPNQWTVLRLHRKICDAIDESHIEERNRRETQVREHLEGGLKLIEGAAPHLETVRFLTAASWLTRYWKLLQDTDAADHFAEAAVEMAEQLDAPVELSAALNSLGTLYRNRGQLRKNLLIQQKRQHLSQDPRFIDLREKLSILNDASHALKMVGNYAQAIPLLMEAEGLADQIREPHAQIRALYLQSECWVRLDRWDEVLLVEEKGKELQKRFPLQRIGPICWLLAFSASVHAFRGDQKNSITLGNESRTIMLDLAGGNEDHWHSAQYY